MNYTRFLLKASQWSRRPPSEARVKLVLGVIAICFILFAVERYIGLPAWMSVEKMNGLR